jgi:hypothetical protein
VRIFKNAWFVRFARAQKISDDTLREAIMRAASGQVDADLGWGRAQTTPCSTRARKVERLSNGNFVPRRTQGIFRVRICQERSR